MPMTSLRIGVAMVLVLAWLGGQTGCAPGTNGPDKRPQDPEQPDKVVGQPDTSECDGKTVETIEEQWPDGTVKLRREVVKQDDGTDISHGVTTTFWEGGQKKLEMYVVCGVRHGPKRTWHSNGNKWSEGEFVNGKENGVWRLWYYEGEPLQQFTMVHGAWHGTYTEWHQNGKKKMEVEYIHGLKQGPQIYWDELGNEMIRIEYVDNVRQPIVRPQDKKENGE